MPKGVYLHKPTEEHGRNISLALRGKKKPPRSAEHARKLGESRRNNGQIRITQHPDYGRIKTHKRRMLLRGVGGNFTLSEWQSVKALYNYMCLRCKKFEPEIKLTIDHILPISKGGRNIIENIQPLCKSCNSSKGKKAIVFSDSLALDEHENVLIPFSKVEKLLRFMKTI